MLHWSNIRELDIIEQQKRIKYIIIFDNYALIYGYKKLWNYETQISKQWHSTIVVYLPRQEIGVTYCLMKHNTSEYNCKEECNVDRGK